MNVLQYLLLLKPRIDDLLLFSITKNLEKHNFSIIKVLGSDSSPVSPSNFSSPVFNSLPLRCLHLKNLLDPRSLIPYPFEPKFLVTLSGLHLTSLSGPIPDRSFSLTTFRPSQFDYCKTRYGNALEAMNMVSPVTMNL